MFRTFPYGLCYFYIYINSNIYANSISINFSLKRI